MYPIPTIREDIAIEFPANERGRYEGKATESSRRCARRRDRADARRGGWRESERTSVFDIARKREREAEKQLAFCTHVRSRDEGTRERVVTMMRWRRAGWTHGGMHLCIAAIYDAELWRFSPRTVPPYDMYTRVHVYDRISSGQTNSISGTIRVRPSDRSFVRPRVNERDFRPPREVN